MKVQNKTAYQEQTLDAAQFLTYAVDKYSIGTLHIEAQYFLKEGISRQNLCLLKSPISYEFLDKVDVRSIFYFDKGL